VTTVPKVIRHEIAEIKAKYNLDIGDKVIYNHRSGKIIRIGYSLLFDEATCLVHIEGDPISISVDISTLRRANEMNKKNPNLTFRRRPNHERRE